jgi:hypothetical protein
MMADERGLRGPKHDGLDAFVLFTDLLDQGKAPDIDEFLDRFPGHGPGLRESLEGARLLHDEVEQVREQHPGFRAWNLLRPPG